MAATKLDLIESRRSELQAAFLAIGAVSEQRAEAVDALRAEVEQLRAELGEAHAGKEHLAARLTALVSGLPGGVLVLDPSGEIQECNPAARELLGEPLVGEPYADVLGRAAKGVSGVGEPTELRTGKFVNISRRELASGGEVVLVTDVTESHLMQRLLARQQRLLTLGELAAGLAHQIRTPLAAALLYASQMLLPGRSPEDLGRCAGAHRREPEAARQAGERHARLRSRRRGARGGERERAARAGGPVAAAGLAPRRPPDHSNAGARPHGARECAVAGFGRAESRHQRAAGALAPSSTSSSWRGARLRAAPRSW